MIYIEDILNELRKNNVSKEKLKEVERAYFLAKEIHKGQYRQSGEEYITHPLHVAKNLIDMEVYDPDTISAALLHDTIEDGDDFQKEDIANIINKEVAELVDGVTKMRRMNFSTKLEQNQANTRKIINGLTKDVRIILIKLADRLHNMQTIEFKKPEKQKENAIETMELFVPLALAIGAYRIKNELEDLSLRYIEPKEYNLISRQKKLLCKTEKSYLQEMKYKLKEILASKNIPNDIIIRTLTVCTAYKKIRQGYKLENIYDLFYLKVLVDEVDDCYRTLGFVHKNNTPINGRFKDYIACPKTYYQSLHTTVSDPNGKLTKVKLRTFDMDKVAAFGVPALWNIKNGKTKEETQAELKEKCQFAKKLIELDESFSSNEEFIKELKNELLTEHVYVYTDSGIIVELPYGSTALDFACQIFPNMLDKMTGVLVNEIEVPINYTLKNNDRVQINTKGRINHRNWEEYAKTETAKQLIKRLNGQK